MMGCETLCYSEIRLPYDTESEVSSAHCHRGDLILQPHRVLRVILRVTAPINRSDWPIACLAEKQARGHF